jgi:hypothetical protein
MTIGAIRLSIIAAAMLAGPQIAAGQGGMPAATTGAAPADRPFNNEQPSLAGQVIPSPQDSAAHNPAVFARDQLPTLAHTFNFTAEQKQQIRDALAAEQGGAGELPAPGTELAQPMDLKPLPDSIAQRMPWVTPYKYVKLGGKIAIVDPNLPVVVAVIE